MGAGVGVTVGVGSGFKVGDFIGTVPSEPVQLIVTAKVASKERTPFRLKCIPYDSTSHVRAGSMFMRCDFLPRRGDFFVEVVHCNVDP